MKRKYTPVAESFRRWDREAGFKQTYDALEDEFVLAAALIDARGRAGLSQEDIAARMQTSQQAVSRLEGGRGNPSLDMLRRFAKATGTSLKISFEPAKATRRSGR